MSTEPRHRIEFRVAVEELGLGNLSTVEPLVEGTPLRELLDGAGEGYAGLVSPAVRWPSRHFLGEPVLGGSGTGLLGCTCGDYGCQWLAADVVVRAGTVEWSGFRGGDGPFPSVGEFVFARDDYEAAVRATGR